MIFWINPAANSCSAFSSKFNKRQYIPSVRCAETSKSLLRTIYAEQANRQIFHSRNSERAEQSAVEVLLEHSITDFLCFRYVLLTICASENKQRLPATIYTMQIHTHAHTPSSYLRLVFPHKLLYICRNRMHISWEIYSCTDYRIKLTETNLCECKCVRHLSKHKCDCVLVPAKRFPHPLDSHSERHGHWHFRNAFSVRVTLTKCTHESSALHIHVPNPELRCNCLFMVSDSDSVMRSSLYGTDLFAILRRFSLQYFASARFRAIEWLWDGCGRAHRSTRDFAAAK